MNWLALILKRPALVAIPAAALALAALAIFALSWRADIRDAANAEHDRAAAQTARQIEQEVRDAQDQSRRDAARDDWRRWMRDSAPRD